MYVYIINCDCKSSFLTQSRLSQTKCWLKLTPIVMVVYKTTTKNKKTRQKQGHTSNNNLSTLKLYDLQTCWRRSDSPVPGCEQLYSSLEYNSCTQNIQICSAWSKARISTRKCSWEITNQMKYQFKGIVDKLYDQKLLRKSEPVIKIIVNFKN